MSFNFNSKDFKMGRIYGKLDELSNNNNQVYFEDFINEANDIFSFEGFKVESWEMMEDIVGIYTSSDTTYVVANGKKILKITDLENYCRLEKGRIIVENVDADDEKELLDYPVLYQIRYNSEEGADEEFYNKDGKWEWENYGEVLEEFNKINKTSYFNVWITKTPAEADEDEFEEQFGFEYPEPERV
jgi:hypothetical protein